MDAFSLLRYWRSNNGGLNGVSTTTNLHTSTIVTQTSDSDDNSADDNDHGPFFDLEFSLLNNDENSENRNGVVFGGEGDDESDGSVDDDVEDDSELKFTLLSVSSSGDSCSSNAAADVNVSVSPSEDLCFEGSNYPDSNVNQTTSLESNSKPPQSRVSLVKHATKFRVMMFKLKKSKSSQSKEEEEQKKKEDIIVENVDYRLSSGSGKSMKTMVKFKVAEVPIVSLFKRDNSSKKAQKKRQNDDESVTNSNPSEEKKFSKEAMQKYLRRVKPLYVRVSKKYGDKLKGPSLESELRKQLTVTESRNGSPAAELNVVGSEPPLLSSSGKGLVQGNLPAGLRAVCKHLGKSRSASTAVVAAAPAITTSKRRDDSLLQKHDGIQSAILHCKRSFKASRDSDCSSSLSSDSVRTNGKSVAEDNEE